MKGGALRLRQRTVRSVHRDARDPVPGEPRRSADGRLGTLEARQAAFEAEALPHLDALHRYALRLTLGNQERAAELVQDALFRAWRGWDGFRPGSNSRAWLMTILRNVYINDYRSRQSRPASLSLDVEGYEESTVFEEVREADPEARFFHRIVDDEVLRAIDDLPELYRETFVLSDLEGLSYGEIGEITGVPVGTVKSRLFRARRALQRALYDYAVEMGFLRPAPAAGPRVGAA